MNLGMRDADFAQLFLDLRALDCFIDQQMHRLAEDCGAAHSGHLVHGMRAPRSRDRKSRQAGAFRVDLPPAVASARLACRHHQFRQVNVADVIAALGFVHVMGGHEQRDPFTGELEKQIPQLAAGDWIDARGRLIEEKHTRPVHSERAMASR